MNPFFWFLVIVAAASLWVALRRLFVWIGEKALSVAEDTVSILTYEETDNFKEGENNNE